MLPKYICTNCGAKGCKLWRQYNTFADHIKLLCVDCAGEDQDEDVSAMDAEGFRPDKNTYGYSKIDQIRWLVPAIPTKENDTYWGYTSVPEELVKWWRGLPTRCMSSKEHTG